MRWLLATTFFALSTVLATSQGMAEDARGVFWTAGAGVAAYGEWGNRSEGQWTVQGEVGLAWREENFLGPRVWHLGVAPSVNFGTGTTSADLALLAGLTDQIRTSAGRPAITTGISGGLEARVFDQARLGPTLKARLGLWRFTFFTQAGVHFDRNRDRVWSARLGIEYIHFH